MEGTMYLVHCNRCFWPKTIDNPNKFFISKCSHIYCQECMPKGPCHLCKVTYKAKAIDANMPKAIAVYFEPPQKAFRKFQKILKFQIKQDTLTAHYWINFMPLQFQQELKLLNGMMRIDAHLEEKLAYETNRIEKLKVYLAYKKRRLQELHQRHQRPARGRTSTISSSNRYGFQGQRLKSPTISSLSECTMSSANCAKSTDLAKKSDSFSKRERNDFNV